MCIIEHKINVEEANIVFLNPYSFVEIHLFIISFLSTYRMKIKFVSFPMLFIKIKISHTGQNSLFYRVYFGICHMGIDVEVAEHNCRKY